MLFEVAVFTLGVSVGVLLLDVHLFLTSVTLPGGPCNAAGLGGHCNLSWKILGGFLIVYGLSWLIIG